MINLGIIGSGMIVHDFLQIADQIPNLELTAISTTKRSEKVGKELQTKYGIKKTFINNDDLFNDQEVNTVYVAVPNNLHYVVAKSALEHNKNVICEKPFVATPEQALELKEIADKHHVYIVEAITNIYLANFIYLKQHLPEIEPVHNVELNYTQYSSRYDNFLKGIIQPVFDPAKDGGALMDLGIYNIHVAIGLFGKPTGIHYFPVMQKEIDTSGNLILTYPQLQASLLASKDSYVTDQWSYIEGEKGSLKIKGPINELREIEIDIKGQEPKRLKLNKYSHRMVAEFVEFSRMFEEKDQQAVDNAFKHSLIALEVLTQAKHQR